MTFRDWAFDGDTYEPELDFRRLYGQLMRVRMLMEDGVWRTIPQINAVVTGSAQAISARLRDLRKEKYGGRTVERRYVARGLYEYRLVPKEFRTRDL